MNLVHIVAIDKNGCIGKNNELPWRIPEDLKHFKETTYRHPIVMGRKTFESIGKPLPDRTNFVLSRKPLECLVAGTIWDTSLESLWEVNFTSLGYKGKVFIIGGAELYKQTIDQANELIITHVDMEVVGGDAFYPPIPEYFKPVEEKDLGNGHKVVTYRKVVTP